MTIPNVKPHKTVDSAESSSAGATPQSPLFSATSSGLSGWLLRVVDASIPEEMHKGDPDSLRRARIILSFSLALIALGLETGLFFAWVLSPVALLRVELALAAALLLAVMIPTVFRRTGSLVIAANLIITAAYIVTVAVLSAIGGISAPLFHWYALPPLLAALMGTRRSAGIWAGISFVTVFAFILADWNGIEFADAVGFKDLAGPALWFQRLVNLASWMGILLAVALLFEDHKNKQTSQMAAQNAELESQMAQRIKAEQRSQYLAYYDELTGLPNRRLFLEQLTAAIEQTSRLDRVVGLIFLDLDRFKEVNDMHGHALGDQLLQAVAGRVSKCVRQSDRVSYSSDDGDSNVARLGGDEFTILLAGIHGHKDAAIVAQRILDSLMESFLLDELELYIGASIGIALYSEGEMNAGDLLRNADLAMYQAKNAGKNNFKFHQEFMNTDIVMRNTMTDSLRKALEVNELELYYQPIVDSNTLSISGVEGLLRWSHIDHEFVSTETLIDIAEESGLILPLGRWVIFEACRQFREWLDAGIDLKSIAVNVSSEQFRRSDVVEVVKGALQEYDVDPGSFVIEITEGVIMIDEDKTLLALEELKKSGVGIALDDFGTGYSSLSYVHRFPVDMLKIDRSFVADVETEEGSRAIATAVIALGHQLGLKIVGEGVENKFQERFLMENGCEEMQGYLYSKPLPAVEIEKILPRTDGSRKH